MLQKTTPISSTVFEASGFDRLQIDVFDDFAALESDWKDLEQDGVATLYQRFDWIKTWTDNVAGPARVKPRLVVGRENDQVIFGGV